MTEDSRSVGAVSQAPMDVAPELLTEYIARESRADADGATDE